MLTSCGAVGIAVGDVDEHPALTLGAHTEADAPPLQPLAQLGIGGTSSTPCVLGIGANRTVSTGAGAERVDVFTASLPRRAWQRRSVLSIRYRAAVLLAFGLRVDSARQGPVVKTERPQRSEDERS